MAEISYFWNGTTVGDATASPYEAASLFSAVMSTLSRGINYPNQGFVLDNANAANRLVAALVSGSGPSTVTVDTGTAVVIGTWYNNSSLLSFLIPHMPPSASTRIDRIVLRKTWASQTVRLVYLEGAPTTGGGAEPALSVAYGVTWDIPICKVTITTGSLVTITDERPLSAAGQSGGTLYVPWLSASVFPSTGYTSTIPGPDIVTLNGVPSNATAVMLSFLKTAGAFSLFQITPTNNSNNLVLEIVAPAAAPNDYSSPIVVPISPGSPSKILVTNATVMSVVFFVQGWYIPF